MYVSIFVYVQIYLCDSQMLCIKATHHVGAISLSFTASPSWAKLLSSEQSCTTLSRSGCRGGLPQAQGGGTCWEIEI